MRKYANTIIDERAIEDLGCRFGLWRQLAPPGPGILGSTVITPKTRSQPIPSRLEISLAG
jgi:hypothetical protein